MQNTEHLLLNVNQVLVVRADQVFVESGTVWLTQSGCLDDVFLSANQSYRSRRSGKVVIQALCGDAKVILQSNSLVFRARKLILTLTDAVSSGLRFGLRHDNG